jgi:hypothetical protein
MLIEKPITAALVAATATAYYTTPANLKKAIIRSVSFLNTDTVPQTVTVHLVPSGGTASATNMLISARSMNAGETYYCNDLDGKVLEAGGMLQCLASAASKVSVNGTILEHSF